MAGNIAAWNDAVAANLAAWGSRMTSWFRTAAAAVAFLVPTMASAVTLDSFELDDGSSVVTITGPFVYEDDARDLVGIVRSTGATTVSFNSAGGNVDAAMRYGRAIRLLDLSTIQLRALECASACALAFLGGVERYAESGAIGVHQSSFSATEGLDTETAVSSIQLGVANTMAYMAEMGADPSLMQLSLTVHSGDMRYLTSAEMTEYRVTTTGGPEDGSSTAPMASRAAPLNAPAASPPPTSPSVTSSAPRDLQRPNRLALYDGLDFLGRDIDMRSVEDGPSCAAECLAHGQCRAFTFNTMTPINRGPNCFLKDAQGDLDGNSAAISGRLLRQLDPDASSYSFGTIDPNTALYRDRDIPGYDLSPRPVAGVETEFQCRMACVNEATCAAFTFVRPKNQCWLKGAVGDARAMAGAVTGVKSASTFAPTHVQLD